MVSVARIIPPPKPQRNATHYHVALEGVLSRRFMAALKFVSFVGYAALLVLAMIRARNMGYISWLFGVYFVPVLIGLFVVLVMRKVKMLLHVDNLTYPNAITSFLGRTVRSTVFLRVYSVYLLSAFVYYSVYKSWMGTMSVTVPLRAFDKSILNERYIYFTLFSVYVATLYSGLHLFLDYGHLRFRIQAMDVPARKRLMDRYGDLTTVTVFYAVFATMTFPIVYFIFRSSIWGWCLFFGRYLFDLHRTNAYGASPFGLRILLDSLLSSFVLIWLWEVTNTAFSVYMSLPPRHNGQFISERSANKNETLVIGLNDKARPLTRTMAFQELWSIALNSKERRISIYSDIEHNAAVGSSCWEKVQRECLVVINDVINNLTIKPAAQPQQPQQISHLNPETNSVLSVKHDESIFAANKGSVSNRRFIENFQDKQAQQSQDFIGTVGRAWNVVQKWLENYSQITKKLLATPFGYPFRCTVERRINAIVPNPLLVHCATLSLSRFVVQSLEEDQFGIVHRHIPDILMDLDKLLTLTENFIQNPPHHWSDVRTDEPDLSVLRHVHEIAEEAFENIVDRFHTYFKGVPLSDEVQKRIRKVQGLYY
jgi:nucleoporin NDC1